MKKLIIFIAIATAFLLTAAYSEITGSLIYEKKFAGAFKGRFEISGLKPDHEYVLCINGYAKHKSNKTLINYCDGYDEPTSEGYCDFAEVLTDKNGFLEINIEEELPKGKYKIKFLVKDPKADWAVVWCEDLVKFKIKEAKQNGLNR